MRSFARLYFDGVYPQDHKKAGQLKLLPSRDTVPHSRDFTRRMWHGVEGMGAICVSGNIILRSIRIALVIKYRPKKFHLYSAQGVDYTSQHTTILPKINSALEADSAKFIYNDKPQIATLKHHRWKVSYIDTLSMTTKQAWLKYTKILWPKN